MRFWGHPALRSLSRGLDGMLGVREKISLDRHLPLCAPCRRRQHALARVKAALCLLPAIEEVPVPFGPQVPNRVSPAARPGLFVAGTVFGILLGALAGGLVFLGFPQPALKVISSSQETVSSEGTLESVLRPGTVMRTLSTGYADLEIPHQLLLRLKPETTMTWQQTGRWPFSRPRMVVNLMRGEILARTKEGFWGSKLEVRTPSTSAVVKGTAFSMSIDPTQEATTVKVLAGSVFISPHLGGVGIHVQGGEKSSIQAQRLPKLPKPLSVDERKALLETYRIGQDPSVSLVLGAGPERVEELLRPALLFVGRVPHPQLQPFLRKVLNELSQAVLEGTLSKQPAKLQALEVALGDVTEEKLAVPLHLFAGACAASLGDSKEALTHFQWVVDRAPKHSLAGLALAAIGVTAQRQMGNADLAHKTFQRILHRYPNSPEAAYVRDCFPEFSGRK